jgi:hypothetical protein
MLDERKLAIYGLANKAQCFYFRLSGFAVSSCKSGKPMRLSPPKTVWRVDEDKEVTRT